MYELKTAVILAAGCGSRLKSLSKGTPKCLLKINSELIITRLLTQLKNSGIEKVIVVVGYKKQQVAKAAKSIFPKAIIVENDDYANDKNLNSFKKAISFVKEGCLVFTSDIVLDDNFVKVACKSVNTGKSVWFTNGTLKSGVVGNVIKSDLNCNIKEIKLLNDYSDEYSDFTKWTGLMLVTHNDLQKYKKVCDSKKYQDVLTYYSQPFIDNLSSFIFKEFDLSGKYKFATFNTPKDYKSAVETFRENS